MLRQKKSRTIQKNLIFLILLLSVNCLSALAQQLPNAEYQALVKIYNATSGQGWANKSNLWNITQNNAHEEDGKAWHGVTIKEGHVVALDLSKNQLRGTIPVEVANLTALKELNLSDNALAGSIPTQLGNLKELTFLDLSCNRLVGNFPIDFSKAIKLESVIIYENYLSGIAYEIPTSVTTFMMEEQMLEYAEFLYEGKDYVIDLPNICLYDESRALEEQNIFRVSVGNAWKDFKAEEGKLTIPSDFLQSAITTQTKINITQLTGAAKKTRLVYRTTAISGEPLSELEYKSLVNIYNNTKGVGWPSQNQWNIAKNDAHEGKWPGVTVANGHVIELRLPNNQMQGDFPRDILNLTSIKVLDLSNNALGGPLPTDIGDHLKELTTITLQNNRLTGEIPKSINELPNLKYLYLQYNRLEEVNHGLPRGLYLNIQYQSIERDEFVFKGEDVKIQLPSILTYDYSKDNNSAKNGFYVYIAETYKTDVYANEEGELIIPKSALLNLGKDQKIRIYQTGGYSAYTNINFKTTTVAVTKIPTIEYNALVAIYNNLNGEKWQDAYKWNIKENNLHEGAWHGVTIDEGHVISINLNDAYYFAGTVPSEIGNLSELKYLNLNRRGGDITGKLPEEIAKLQKLEELHIGGHKFGGEVPKVITKLAALKVLGLQGNEYIGEIPTELTLLDNLVTLNLSTNKFEGQVPTFFPSMKLLSNLYLNNNSFKGAVPKEYATHKFANLQLQYNQLDDLEKGIADGTGINIQYQNLYYDEFVFNGEDVEIQLPRICQYRVPNHFDVKNRFYLYIAESYKAEAYANEEGILKFPKESFQALKTDQKIRIYQTGGYSAYTNIHYKSTSIELKQVEEKEYKALVAIFNALNGEKWQDTYKWDISENSLHQSAWHGVVIENGHVVSINLNDAYYFAGEIPKEIGDLPELRYLNLNRRGGNITGEIPEEIAKLQKLEELHIGSHKFGGEIPKVITKLAALRVLGLQSNEYTGEIPEELTMLEKLVTLNLSDNKFEGQIPVFFSSMEFLSNLYLNSNKFKGALPKEYASHKFVNLQLQYNQLDDLAEGIADGTGVNIQYQNIYYDKFVFNGEDVEIQLPRICQYRVPNHFDAKNRFYLYITENYKAEAYANEDGILKFPKELFQSLTPNQKIRIYQTNGYAAYTNIHYESIVVELKKVEEKEYKALVAIFDALNGEKWQEAYRWNTSENNLHKGPWHGVSIEDGHVVSINLHDAYYFAGEIPKEIGDFPKLRYLNFNRRGGYITGEIPEEMGNLKELESLYLSSHQLTGAIPEGILKLPKLKYFNVYGNRITTLDAILDPQVSTDIDLRYQNVIHEEFKHTGESIDIQLPNICLYDYANSSFDARNNFKVTYGHGELVVTPNDDGVITIPREFLLNLNVKSQLVITQETGTASSTRLTFNKISIELTQLPPKEYEALLAIHKNLGGTAWSNKWDVKDNNAHLGGWYGVGIEDGHVVSLYLYNNNLRGTIPAEIGDLTHLRSINLAPYHPNYGYITGEIPFELGKLTQLEELIIKDHKSLGGSITFWIDKLTKLKHLDLRNNNLSGEIPSSIEKISNLKHLDLAFNKLSGGIPDDIGNLTYLSKLYLQNNQLTGTVPASLNNLPSIRELYLNNNMFDALEAPLPYQSHITVNVQNQTIKQDKILIGGDYVVYTLPRISRYYHERENFFGIYKFGLYINNVKVTPISVESDLEGKVSFGSVYFNNIKESDKISIKQENGSAQGTNIEFDEFYIGVPIDNNEFAALVDLYNSTNGDMWTNTWDITKNDLHLKMWYGVVIEDGHIIKLDLQNNNLEGTIPASLSKLTELTQLSLYNNKLSGTIPASLGSLSKLEYLSLYKNQLTGNIPTKLYKASELIELLVNINQLSGDIPNEISNLAKLSRLNISNNEYTGSVPSSLHTLPSIKELNISYNKYNDLKEAFDYADNVSIYIQGQTIDIPEYVYTEGTTAKAKVSKMNMYDLAGKEFNAANTFEFYVNEVLKGVSSTLEEDVVIFDGVLDDYEEGQAISITQRNGSAYGSTMTYLGVRDVSQIPVLDEEYDALVTLYNDLGGKGWTKKKWNVTNNDIHLGGWEGVSFRNGHVTGIELDQNNLKGILPDIFRDLPKLKVLSLSNNTIAGNIPTSLIELEELEKVQLSSNTLSSMDEVAFNKNVKLYLSGQYLNTENFDLTTTSVLSDTPLNKYDHENSTFVNSRRYELVMMDPLRSSRINTTITISDNAPYSLMNLTKKWNAPKGTVIRLTSIDQAAIYTQRTYNLIFKDGDANMDNAVNVLDIQLIIKEIQGEVAYNIPFNNTATDLNQDGSINILDIVTVANIVQENELEGVEESRTRSFASEVGLSVEDGILYINASTPVAAFDIRFDDNVLNKIEKLSANSDIQLSIVANGNDISVLGFNPQEGTELNGKVAIAKVGSAKVKNAIIANSNAQPMSWNIEEGDDNISIIETNKQKIGDIYNYPNPFSESTTLKYTLPENVKSTTLRIFNTIGQQQRAQRIEETVEGQHEIMIHREGLATGVYFYVLEVRTDNKTIMYKNKMIVK